MSSRESSIAISAALALAAALAIASLRAAGTAPRQPKIGARVSPVLKAGNLSFKDLNHNGVLDPYEDWRLPVEKRVADLVSRMTLEEKAGLMQITSFNAGSLDDYLNQRRIRYLILRDNLSARELAARANASQELAEKSRLGIPIVFTSNPRNHVRDNLVYEEAEAAGEFSSWPGTLGLAATNDLKLIRAFAEVARAEWRAAGIQKCYGYQVDVATEPRWYRIQTTFGESAKWNAEIAREIVLGFQGPALGPDSVAQSIKHFPGDGAVDKGLDPHNNWGQWAVYPTPGSFFKYQLPPFQAAVDAGASSIMSYYNNPSNEKSAAQLPREWWRSGTQQFEEVAGAYNTVFLTRLLRGRMGFKGYVNTDSGVLTNNAFGVEKLTTPQRFAKAVKAGVALFSDNNNPQGLLDAVHQHLLEESDLTPAVSLLLKEIFQLGLFENPYTDPEAAQKIASSPVSAARADEAHRKSIVLLRNDRKLLPLRGPRKLYVEVMAGEPAGFGGRGGFGGRRGAEGRGAAGEQQPGRAGRGQFAGRGRPVAVDGTARLKALLAQDPSVRIVDSIDQADEALLWLRPTVYQRPEHDYADIALSTLTGVDVAKVKQIEAAKPTVLVINFINPWIINEVEPGAAAVLATFDVKAEALLDVVRGRFKPSGKLPLTIPADQAAVDRNAPDVPGYAEAFDYAYRNRVNDKYVFGFGLSYGK
ncbi:MAG: glycoside hydrolase family 3 C-terminal domain-containing protein [Acidobacteria bacterium]|nr:glycoside hydrolase family 3 C-terminal domain-containing protein [Acidobacteriota bacterium]